MQVPQQPGAQPGYQRLSLCSWLSEGLCYEKGLGSPELPGILLSVQHTVLKARGRGQPHPSLSLPPPKPKGPQFR